MRICVVSPYSPLAVTGIGTFITELARVLREKGHESVILAPTSDIPFVDASSYELKDNLLQVRIERFSIFKNLFLSLFTAVHLLRHRKSYDVVHSHQPHLQSLAAAFTAKVLGTPVFVTYHLKVPRPEGFIRRAILGFIENNLHRFCTLIIFVSYDAKKSFSPTEGDVIWNGVDVEKFKPDPDSRNEIRKRLDLEEKVVFIFAGRWAEIKGIDETLRAFKIAGESIGKKISLILTGGGDEEYEKMIRSQIGKMDMHGSIKALGRVEDLLGYYQASDVFLLPSYSEGLPIALIEAMSSGLAPIVSSVGGNTEVVEDGINGVLVRPGDVQGLANGMQRMASDPKFRKGISEAARRRIEDEFSLEKMAARYLEFYESRLEKP